MTCPKCGSADIRASRSDRWSDIFHRFRGRDTYRCRNCRMRFYASESAQPGPKQADQSKPTHRHPKLISTRKKKRLIRRLIVISIFALAFIMFWFFLRYLTTEKSPAQDSGTVSSLHDSSPA